MAKMAAQTIEFEIPPGADPRALRGLLASVIERPATLGHVTNYVANLPTAIGVATGTQILMVDEMWRAIEERYGVLDASDYATLTGAAATNRSAASKARVKGLLGYRRGSRVLYPRFQFEGRGLRAGWLDIVSPLREATWDDEDIILWLTAPHGALARRTPIEALDAGDREQVLALVGDQAAGIW